MVHLGEMLTGLLGAAAAYGRILLILGLVLGIFSPDLAVAAKPWIQEMIAALLFLSALRIGPQQMVGVARDISHTVAGVLIFQLLLPVLLALAFLGFGWTGILPTALVLMAAAAPISGSPNLAIMAGHDPAPALRLLTLGTALLPLTVLPVFWLVPALGSGSDVLAAAARLLGVIALSVALAFAIRVLFLRDLQPSAVQSIDGLSAILMGVVVIGLMSAVGPTLFEAPGELALNLAVVFATNFALQIATASLLRRVGEDHVAVPFAVVAGNRNMALFLAALPVTVTDPLLLFIGCYQIPMYLTPVLLHRFYRPGTPVSLRR
ncbi:putative Na+-dependent transporter [Mesorhizobium sp. J18]|nr:putative Na+-dependent transporter [Mesorhizobium sp. J18]